MKSLISVLGAILLLTTSRSYAQNETKSFSASVNNKGSYTKPPSGVSDATINNAISYKHVFAITPEQEVMLNQQDVEIELIFDEYGAPLKLSDDPKWQAGNPSVKIKKTGLVPNGVIKLSATAKWGNGQFSISAKINEVRSGPLVPIKSTRAPGHPVSTTKFETFIVGSDNFSADGYVSFDLKTAFTRTIKADGSESESESFNIKSKSLVEKPL